MTDKTIDLGAFDTMKGAEAGYELTLIHPKDGNPTPAKIRVLGADSEAFRGASRARVNSPSRPTRSTPRRSTCWCW